MMGSDLHIHWDCGSDCTAVMAVAVVAEMPTGIRTHKCLCPVGQSIRGQEEKGTTEDEMVGWHQRLSAHGFGWTLGVGDGQGGLACCSSWGHKESDMHDSATELN